MGCLLCALLRPPLPLLGGYTLIWLQQEFPEQHVERGWDGARANETSSSLSFVSLPDPQVSSAAGLPWSVHTNSALESTLTSPSCRQGN